MIGIDAACGAAPMMATQTPGAARAGADVLCLAASPTFAVMALLTFMPGGDADMPCMATHAASPLGGMAAMYALMSAFHSAPWLKRFSRRQSAARSPS